MDISSKGKYPSNALSNFSPHEFEVDGVLCASMEGFLQALKSSNPDIQEVVCTYVGKKAKKAGAKKNWHKKQVLYWQGEEIERDSPEYQALLDRAFDALYQNTGFQKALRAAGNASFTHSMGKRKRSETVLTTSEFCSRLTRLRDRLLTEQVQKRRK